MINTKVIKELNPCTDRFQNWIKFYGNNEFTYAQFLGLKRITHSDKMWVVTRLMKPELLRFFAADVAELVLPIFESKYPNDNRPRLAIEAARAIPFDRAKAKAAASASYAAAASYADYAAAYAAHCAADAYNADNAAAYNAAAYNAAATAVFDKINSWLLNHLNDMEEWKQTEGGGENV